MRASSPNAGTWPKWAKLPREGALFIAASLLAGLGHYAFQILASRSLTAPEFARLSGWHAHLGLAFVVAGLAQYASNFHPLDQRRLPPILRISVVVSLLLAGSWWSSPDPVGLPLAGVIATLAIVYGWILGQAQIRLDFRGLAIAQILVAVTKLITPLLAGADLAAFSFAIGFSYLPGTALLAARLHRRGAGTAPDRTDDVASVRRSWTAPVILSLAANLIPQYDLILTQHILPADAFDEFARASLFYKGIYFFVFIFAQWVLPRQIRGEGRWAGLGLAAAFAAAASVGLSIAAPLFARYVFAWPTTPDQLVIFLSCVNMSLLTLIFLNVQGDCANGRVRRGALVLASLSLEAMLQLLWRPDVVTYLVIANVAQAALLLAGMKFHSGRRP